MRILAKGAPIIISVFAARARNESALHRKTYCAEMIIFDAAAKVLPQPCVKPEVSNQHYSHRGGWLEKVANDA